MTQDMIINQLALVSQIDPIKEVNNTSSNKNFQKISKPIEPQNKILWKTVAIYIAIHFAALYGLYLGFISAKIATILFAVFVYNLSFFGTTAGAHRLWSHRAYKATWQLKCILVFCHTLTYEHSIIHWARDHRTHHKYSETDADPHNANKGFFFSHIGWLLCKKHKDVKEKGKTVDLSDLYNDPILRFQDKYYMALMLLLCFLLPAAIPTLLWKEPFVNAFFVNVARYILQLHAVGLVNSGAHLWGNKPYDKQINPGQNPIISFLTGGEGWHNYHHTFPWDYKASEFGRINLTTRLINFFALIGWAYDLRSTPNDSIKSRVQRSGDGSHEKWGLFD